MNCREFIDFLDDYFTGVLSPEEAAVFDAHLAECPYCTAYLASYRSTVRLAAAARDEGPPADAPEDLIRAILASRPRPADTPPA
jgi:anti-sigma factor RsiW